MVDRRLEGPMNELALDAGDIMRLQTRGFPSWPWACLRDRIRWRRLIRSSKILLANGASHTFVHAPARISIAMSEAS